MAYTRTTWATGDTISATLLNNLETGVTGILDGTHRFTGAIVVNNNSFAVQNASAQNLILLNAATNRGFIQLFNAGVSEAVLGVAGSNNALITGSIADDLCIRSDGQNTLFSADSGTTAHAKLTSTGYWQAWNGSALAAAHVGASTKTTAAAPYANDGYITVYIAGTAVKLMTTA